MPANRNKPGRQSEWLVPGLAAAILAYAVWASSPLLFSAVEPWDTPYPFYSVTLFFGGLFIGYVFSAVASPALGAWAGQVAALLTLPGHDRDWILLGVVTTGIGSLLVLAGVLLGRLACQRINRARDD